MRSLACISVTAIWLGALAPQLFSKEAAKTPEAAPKQAVRPLRSVSEIAEAVRPSLVKITQVGREGPFGIGSGFVIGKEGLIATNRHVIGEGRRLKVETSDGRSHEVVEIVANDARLDLAVLRVATKGLKPLELGDSDKAQQGQPIVAMGNPMGMSYSVVEGVLSEPKRDIEGQPMLQVAVPIEQGNSGGPLLDRRGRVLGVLTLKSALADNLGFAMPVSALKLLVAKPNPVPMDRWLTLGVLNPLFWKSLMGAQWSQRAGVINVSQTGSGFGGRALCLWNQEPAADVFEATVTVRLKDEAGAAGLAFCADGGERHYGFYPTGGKMRLTRFDGADVFSWKILQELETPGYRQGDWNTLRVRVEKERIQCFVNEMRVFDLEDTGLRGGKAGLCKFRTTEAGFKKFRVGLDLADKGAPEVLAEGLKQSMEAALAAESESEKQRAVEQFLQEPEMSRQLFTDRKRSLQKELQRLGELDSEVHYRSVRQKLVAELSRPEEGADLLRCALLLSKHDNPELDLDSYERGVEQMVQEIKEQPEFKQGTSSAVGRLKRYLFEENGFHGSRTDYGSRSNSYVNEVLDDREGLPITLSVVFMELARRLGIKDVVGIPLPGRFMVGYREDETQPFTLLDVYEGGKELTLEQGIALVSEEGMVPAKSTQPASKRDILLRMVRNLLSPALESKKPTVEALPYLDLLLDLDPEASRERVNRAMLRERAGDKSGARSDITWLREHLPANAHEELSEMLEQWMERLRR